MSVRNRHNSVMCSTYGKHVIFTWFFFIRDTMGAENATLFKFYGCFLSINLRLVSNNCSNCNLFIFSVLSFSLLQVIWLCFFFHCSSLPWWQGGHYVTEVKHDAVGEWLRFDDSIVRTVGYGQLFKYNLPRMFYLLMYRRADIFSASAPRPAGGNSSSPDIVGSGNAGGHLSGRK